MKILCIIDHLGSGGAQRQLVTLACALKGRGHEVEFCVYYPDDHYMHFLVQKKIPVHFVAKSNKFSLQPVFFIRKLIFQGNFDAVIAFLETPCVYAELATIFLKNIILIVSERNTVKGDRISITRKFKSYLHICANAIVSNSYSQAKWLKTQFSFLRNKVFTVWNGVDSELFCPVDEENCLRKYGSELSLLVVARVTPEKNALGLVKAISLCRTKGLDVTVDWVGAVLDVGYLKQVEGLIQEELIADHFSFLGPCRDVQELMRRYDALILPSFYEGLPNVVCEALSSGLPVLVSNVCDNKDLVQDMMTGVLFDPESPESIADAIAVFNNLSIEEKNNMSLKARAFAINNLSIEVMVHRYEVFFNK